MASAPHVLVLGGGIVGVTSAYYLARRGLRVTLIERRAGLGLETSFANGSLVTPSMADPWAAPGLPWKLVRWMGRENAPFLVRPSALPGFLPWGLRFLANCNGKSWRRNTETILKIAAYSCDALDELSAETGIVYDRATSGTLRVFRDPLSMSSAQRSAELVGALGIRYETLDADGCARLEPALAPVAHKISGGIRFPDDRSGDAFKFTRAVAQLASDAGVVFRCGVAVHEIETAGAEVAAVTTDHGRFEADRYLMALGWASAKLLRKIGIRVPIYPVKGYSVTLRLDGWNDAPAVPLVDDGRKMAIVRLGDRLRLAGTAEIAGADTSLNQARTDNLIAGVRDLLPGFPNLHTAEHWAGLRPMTPDGVPILGDTRYRNLYLNLGHGHLGWTMACGTARVLADLILGTPPEIDVSDMGLVRARGQPAPGHR